VFRIVGTIPAVNFIKVPKDRPLGLTGRFLYLQVWCQPASHSTRGFNVVRSLAALWMLCYPDIAACASCECGPEVQAVSCSCCAAVCWSMQKQMYFLLR
jgi:hypothetical protein